MHKTAADFLAQARPQVISVDGEEAEILLQDNGRILDVREAAEFGAGHLPGAINIPRGVLEFMLPGHPDFSDLGKDILIYCKNGGRSTLAAYTLKQMGYSQVKMLAGGFDGWKGDKHNIELDQAI